jgi:hypothetical protein
MGLSVPYVGAERCFEFKKKNGSEGDEFHYRGISYFLVIISQL